MILVELCSGTAALSLSLFGQKPPCGYMGSKRRYAKGIAAALGLPRPEGVVLNDPGPWGRFWENYDPEAVAEALRVIPDQGEECFRRLSAEPPPENPAEWCAAFLCLQAAAVGCKPVAESAVGWRTAGYARLSPTAVRKGFKDRLIPGNIAKRLPEKPPCRVLRLSAEEVPVVRGAVVYLDPPYSGTTGYGATVSREAVANIAQKWADAGCVVAISEAEPLDLGWYAVPLGAGTNWQADTFAKGHREWLTFNRPFSP